MNILAVDSNKAALDSLKDMLEKSSAAYSASYFQDPLAALAKAREEEIDVAFLEMNMPELNGIDLGNYLKELNPYINLIYVSDDTQKAFDALRIHASGFVKKPGDKKTIDEEMDNLRYPEIRKKIKRVFVQTFGNFEFFVDGKPVEFKYTRTKEIIAILINNKGAQTTNGEIIASLWEDDADPEKKISYLSNLRQDLVNTFAKLKLDGIIMKKRGSMAIAKDRIECDLFDWLEKKDESKYKYLGDYMNQYSWAEFMHAELDELSYGDADWDED